MTADIIEAIELGVVMNGRPLFNRLSFSIPAAACCAITGPSGSGKTTLLNVIAGKQHYSGVVKVAVQKKIVLVPQQHRFLNRSNVGTFYYQQRFNASEAEDAKTVAEAYPELFASAANAAELQASFGINDLSAQSLLHLSNGENKRLQLAAALLKRPHILLLDAPFTGLDIATRSLLEHRFAALCRNGVTVVFTCAANHVPVIATQVISLPDKERLEAKTEAELLEDSAGFTKNLGSLLQEQIPIASPVIDMRNVNIHYGNKSVLQGISWRVNSGERWALSGPNGAGKSTLLSLITADNPQAYANEIYLFGRKRGSGESIWDIKKNIGYVSPELHLHFDQGSSVFDVVASGLFDTIGLFRVLSPKQSATVLQWLHLLRLEHMKGKLLAQLPLGIQRMALLARALIKCPPLLVLDEPLQGLDEEQATLFKSIIESLCTSTNQTLIYVSHYANDLPQCITHHLSLAGGKVV